MTASFVSLPPPPLHGKIITVAYLNAVFKAFTDVLNGGLGRANFRARPGIRNQEKTSPTAWLPLTWATPEISVAPATAFLGAEVGIGLAGFFALPNFSQVGGTYGFDGVYDENDQSLYLKEPIALQRMDGYHSGLGNQWGAGDTLSAKLFYRMYPSKTFYWAYLDLGATAAHTLVTADLSSIGLVDLAILQILVTTANARTARKIQNPRVTLWTKAPHVV